MKYCLAALLGVLGAVALPSLARADEVLISNLSLLEQLSRGAAEEIAEALEVDRSTPVTIISTSPHEGNAFVKRILAESLASRGYQVTVARSAGEIDTVASSPAATAPSGRTPPGRQVPPAAADSEQADSEQADAEQADSEQADSEQADSEQADSTATPLNGTPAVVETPPVDPAKMIQVETPATPTHGAGVPAPFQVTGGCTVPLGAFPDGVTLDVQLLEFGVQYSEVGRRLLIGPVSFTRVAGVYAQVSALTGPRGQLSDVYTAQRHHWDRVAGRQRVLAEGVGYPYRRPELNAPGLGNYVEPAVVVGIVGSLIYLFYANQN